MKFNLFKRKQQVVSNFEGAKAFSLTPELALYSAVVTAGLNDTFYESEDDRLKRIKELMTKNEPEFVSKLAVYTRNEMHLRSIPLVLTVELAKLNSGNSLVSKTVNGVVKRADEISELLAYYQLANNRKSTKKLDKLSKQIQKGLSIAFNKFDEYQFAKYNRQTEVQLRDALFLVHPKAKNEEQQVVFNKIASNTLETPYTWETELSALGTIKFENEKEKKQAIKAKWEALIDSQKMGYMAVLRNLRNILTANVSSIHVKKVCDLIANEQAVLKSKQLPFRFLSAYREIKIIQSLYTVIVLEALEKAISISANNIKGFNEDVSVLIACDVSGSMQKSISAKSTIEMFDIGLVLGMLLQSQTKKVVSGMFGDEWKVINMPKSSILRNVEEFRRREGEVGYSTNGYKVIDYLINKRMVIDKVMLFTDCQLWDSKHGGSSLVSSWNKYKKIAPNATLFLFDLAGYGNIPIHYLRKDVVLIAGWSDKVFEIMNDIENSSSVIEKIKQIEI